MATVRFTKEDTTGLIVAVGLHGAVLALLLFQFATAPPASPPPQRVTVSLAEEVGLTAASPQPVPESREALAPALDDILGAAEPEPTDAMPRPAEAAVALPRPREAIPPRAVRQARPAERVARARANRAEPRAERRQRATPSAARQGGGSRIGSDFLPGAGDSSTSSETRAPASVFGARERAALSQAINRQLKPHWRGRTPQGLEAEQLVTVLSWEMNEDGSLRGVPRVVSQSGITDANRAQADRHAEVAIAAVKRAAPFNLPAEFYDEWKRVSDWRFDRRL